MLRGAPRGAVISALALFALLSAVPTASAALPAPSYFSLQAGAVGEDPGAAYDVFSVVEFVLAEPVGAPANQTLTREIWQTLQISFIGNATPFDNWSVTSESSGRVVLSLNLTVAETAQIEASDSLLSLAGSAEVGNATVGAAGTITAATLLGAQAPPNVWEQWFGIPAPPGFNSPQDVIVTLADLNGSVAGRALYMAVTLIAATVYVYAAHKMARDRVSGRDKATEAHRPGSERVAVRSRKREATV